MRDSRRLVTGVVLLLILGAVLAVYGGSLNIGLPTGCDWQRVEVDGETFASLEEFRTAAESQGIDFDGVFGEIAFRETGDGLEWRPDECGLQEVPASQ